MLKQKSNHFFIQSTYDWSVKCKNVQQFYFTGKRQKTITKM